MEFVNLILSFLPNFLLVLCRMTGFFLTAPVFSVRNNVPLHFRVGIAVFAAFMAFAAAGSGPLVPFDAAYVYYVVRETLIGILLGFVAYLIFTVVQIAGSFMDMQMGLGIANVIDPMTGMQNPVLGSFKFIIAMLLFLSWNGHHYLLLGIMDSYRVIPLDNTFFAALAAGAPTELLTKGLSAAFTLAFQMAAPIVATMFMVDVALGMLVKTAPQFNVFVVGIPIKIIVGFSVLFLTVAAFTAMYQMLFAALFEHLNEMMRALRAL